MNSKVKFFGSVILFWVVVSTAESIFIEKLDKDIRSDYSEFVSYVEKLPPVLSIDNRKYLLNCKKLRTGVFWEYEVCLKLVNREPLVKQGNCTAPFYKVVYFRPEPILRATLGELHTTILSISRDKKICDFRDLSGF